MSEKKLLTEDEQKKLTEKELTQPTGGAHYSPPEYDDDDEIGAPKITVTVPPREGVYVPTVSTARK